MSLGLKFNIGDKFEFKKGPLGRVKPALHTHTTQNKIILCRVEDFWFWDCVCVGGRDNIYGVYTIHTHTEPNKIILCRIEDFWFVLYGCVGGRDYMYGVYTANTHIL